MLKKDENCKMLPVDNVDNFLEAPKMVDNFICRKRLYTIKQWIKCQIFWNYEKYCG